MRENYQRGQVLLIVVLVMVTVLTIGLSVAARTITNSRTSHEAENSERAFSAAEAGIEQSLTSNSPVSGSFSNKTTYQTTVSTVAGIEFPLNNSSPILKDDSIDVWLSTYPNYTNPWSGTMTIYWGNSANSCTNSEATNSMAALEIVVLSGTTANPQLTRYAVDPCIMRSLSNKFEFGIPRGGVVSGKTYAFSRTINVTSGLFVRVIPLYAATPMAVRGCNFTGLGCTALPSQGTVVESVGIADNTQRKLVTFRQYPKLPTELFPYSYFAPQ